MLKKGKNKISMAVIIALVLLVTSNHSKNNLFVVPDDQTVTAFKKAKK